MPISNWGRCYRMCSGSQDKKMLQQLVKKDTVDIANVMQLAHWKLKPKMEAIEQSLEGKLTDHHRFMVKASLEHMRFIEQQLKRLDEEIQRRLQPYQEEYALLQTIPGIKETGAARILAEIGADMSPFPDGDHLSSWGGACPGNNESAGKKFQSKIRKGNPHLLSAMTQCAWAATKKKDCHFRNKYYRLKSRRGSQRAIVAVDHAMLKWGVHSTWEWVTAGTPFSSPSEAGTLPESPSLRSAWPKQ